MFVRNKSFAFLFFEPQPIDVFYCIFNPDEKKKYFYAERKKGNLNLDVIYADFLLLGVFHHSHVSRNEREKAPLAKVRPATLLLVYFDP